MERRVTGDFAANIIEGAKLATYVDNGLQLSELPTVVAFIRHIWGFYRVDILIFIHMLG